MISSSPKAQPGDFLKGKIKDLCLFVGIEMKVKVSYGQEIRMNPRL
jgi:hypothetical protein